MTSQPSGETASTPALRVAWAILILATLYICYFSHLGVIGFVGPDEPRYAWVARDMAETGDWVTPRLYGKPWFEKPPLLYWGGAIFFKLFPTQPEIAARLTSAICALLATLALAWLAWRADGEECARWLLLLLPTSVGMIGFSHAAATDMPFAGMLTIAMVCAAVVLGLTRNESTPILPRTPWLTLLLFGFFLALAVLAKGPAAIILSGGAIFFWAIFTKRWRDAFRLLHPATIASFCVTALPWYMLCARRNPDFFRIFIIEHNFKRYLTPEFQHVQPFWYYAAVLLAAFLPWTFALLGAIIFGAQKLQRDRRVAPLTILILCWALFCVLFFSISKSKLPGYILPAFPAIALLLAMLCRNARTLNSRLLSFFAALATVIFCLAAGALAIVGHSLAHTSPTNERAAIAGSIFLFLFAVANFFLCLAISRASGLKSEMRIGYAAGTIAPVLVGILLVTRLVPNFFPTDPSGKTIAAELSARGVSPPRLLLHGMNRGTHFSLNFYLKQEIPDWDTANTREGYLLLGGRGCLGVVGESFTCSEPPTYFEESQRYLYRVAAKTSLDRPAGGRQPQ